MPHSYASVFVHVVFATKERLPQIDSDLEERLYPYLAGILRQLNGKSFTVNGSEDHVHVLASLPPKLAIADVIERLKACSSKWIHETFPARHAFSWQRGYAAFSVSASNISRVASYIERQKIHHKKFDFQDEFIRLLRRHHIASDERFLWT